MFQIKKKWLVVVTLILLIHLVLFLMSTLGVNHLPKLNYFSWHICNLCIGLIFLFSLKLKLGIGKTEKGIQVVSGAYKAFGVKLLGLILLVLVFYIFTGKSGIMDIRYAVMFLFVVYTLAESFLIFPKN